jgi:Flp pilus assembly protein TadG
MTRQDREHGAALVELALVMPLLALLIFALFDAGRAVIVYSELTNAARMGARVAMVNQSNDATCSTSERTFKCAAADLTTAMGINAGSIPNVAINGSDCTLLGACSATVTMNYAYVPLTPVISDLIGPINLSASATMPIERQYSNP